MSKPIKVSAIVVGAFLLIAAIVAFTIAVYKGMNAQQQTPNIQIYINDNDSIINQLQTDVEHLATILKDMQNDSITVTVIKNSKSDHN